MGLFNFFKNGAKRTSDDTTKKQNQNGIEEPETLIIEITQIVYRHFDNVGVLNAHNLRLIIWIDCDEMEFQHYNNKQIKASINSHVSTECEIIFETIDFKIGLPDPNIRCTPIGNSGKVFIQIITRQNEPPLIPRRAKITIWKGTGKMKKRFYILDADSMKEQNISAYNIGIGERPILNDGSYRENHIAIDDNMNSDMFENNKYVSRSHAHISYNDNIGFYIQADLNGTRLMGKRTRIIRGSNKIELENINVGEPLQNGDQIELSKKVILLFTTID